MNPSTYKNYPEKKKEAKGYTKVGIVNVLGWELVQTSYYKKAGAELKDLVDAGLEIKGIDAYPSNEAQWEALAANLGIPKEVPTSVWAIESIEENKKILSETVWNAKTMRNIDAMMAAFDLNSPGTYRAPLLEGPPGASKTHSAIALAALLGRPVMYIRAEAGERATISANLLRGGQAPVDRERWALMEDIMRHGVNSRPASRLKYLQTVGRIMKEEGKSFVEAHKAISRQQWEEMADLEAIPPNALTYQKVGLAEIGRRNGAVLIFDEANRWSLTNLNEMESFLQDPKRNSPINTLIILCCNTVQDGGAAGEFNQSLLSRCQVIKVEPLSEEETISFLHGMFGVVQNKVKDGKVQAEHGEFTISEEIEKRLRELGFTEDEINSLEAGSRKNSSMSILMSQPGCVEILKRLGEFHVEMCERTSPGGLLDASKYQEGSAPRVTMRTLVDLFKRFSGMLERSAGIGLDEEHYLELIQPNHVAVSLVKSIESLYLRPFTYDIPGEITSTSPQSGMRNTAEIIQQIMLNKGLNIESIVEQLDKGVDWNEIIRQERESAGSIKNKSKGDLPPNFPILSQKSQVSGLEKLCADIAGDIGKVTPELVQSIESKMTMSGYDLKRPEGIKFNPATGELSQYAARKMFMRDEAKVNELSECDERHIAQGLYNTEAIIYKKPGDDKVYIVAKDKKGEIEKTWIKSEEWNETAKQIIETGSMPIEDTNYPVTNIRTAEYIKRTVTIHGQEVSMSRTKTNQKTALDKGTKERVGKEPTAYEIEAK
jgi:DNA polymerase III delta prime subunit